MEEFYWSCVLRVEASGALDANHGKIIPSYREIVRETSCPSRTDCGQPHAGALLKGLVVAKVSQTITETGGKDPQPITPASVLEEHTSLRPTPGNIITKKRFKSEEKHNQINSEQTKAPKCPATRRPGALCQQLSQARGWAPTASHSFQGHRVYPRGSTVCTTPPARLPWTPQILPLLLGHPWALQALQPPYQHPDYAAEWEPRRSSGNTPRPPSP